MDRYAAKWASADVLKKYYPGAPDWGHPPKGTSKKLQREVGNAVFWGSVGKEDFDPGGSKVGQYWKKKFDTYAHAYRHPGEVRKKAEEAKPSPAPRKASAKSKPKRRKKRPSAVTRRHTMLAGLKVKPYSVLSGNRGKQLLG